MMLSNLADDLPSETDWREFPPGTCEGKRLEVVPVKSRILIIDDDPSFCELLSLYFVAKGFDVIARACPKRAKFRQNISTIKE